MTRPKESPWPEPFRESVEAIRAKFAELPKPTCAATDLPKREWYGRRKGGNTD